MVERFNQYLRPGDPKLYVPHMRFNRAIGRHAGEMVHPQTGEPMDEKEYRQRIDEFLPTEADKKLLKDILTSEKKWIAPKQGARDPLVTIAEPRKKAINL